MGVSCGVGTPPESKHRAGLAFLRSTHQWISLNLLVGQCLHEAFFATEQRESGYIHALQLFQHLFSVTHGEGVLCYRTWPELLSAKSMVSWLLYTYLP